MKAMPTICVRPKYIVTLIQPAVQASMKSAVARMRGASVVIGKMSAGSASTRRMFAMLEPMMFPCARPTLSFMAA